MDVAAEIARHRDYLFGVAYRMLGSRQDAEDRATFHDLLLRLAIHHDPRCAP